MSIATPSGTTLELTKAHYWETAAKGGRMYNTMQWPPKFHQRSCVNCTKYSGMSHWTRLQRYSEGEPPASGAQLAVVGHCTHVTYTPPSREVMHSCCSRRNRRLAQVTTHTGGGSTHGSRYMHAGCIAHDTEQPVGILCTVCIHACLRSTKNSANTDSL